MRALRLSVVAMFASLLGACSDEPTPIGPAPTSVATASVANASIATITGPGGLDGFHFAAPIVNDAVLPADRDKSLLDLLAVEICEWDGLACISGPIRRLDAESSGAGRLRLEDGIYRAVWNSHADNLESGRAYRIRVLASGAEIGYVGLAIRESGPKSTNYADGAVQLIAGASLPIAFVIEPGTGERVTRDASTIELANGAVSLVLPANAVSDDLFLTAVSVDDASLPSGRPTVPGTAWDLGPDGLVFAQSVRLTLRYDPALVPSGVDPAELRIHKVVGGEYVQQPAGRVDAVNGTVSADVDGFSILVVVPRDPNSLEDRVAPSVRSLSVKSPAMLDFADLVELDVGVANAPYTMRVSLTDDAAGVAFIDLRYMSETGRQERFTCYTGAPANIGSDTDGEWDCVTAMPRYAESGDWTPVFMVIRDRVNNVEVFVRRPAGFCNQTDTVCIPDVPIIRVLPSVNDIQSPILTSLQVSLATEPRTFNNALVLAASAVPRTLVFGFQASDDLAGVGNGLIFDLFQAVLRGPGNQDLLSYPSCVLRSGSPLDGFWECQVALPAQAATGIWSLVRLRVPDRAGNGGWTAYSDYVRNAGGQLCNRESICVSNPTIEVTGAGDNDAPLLESFAASAVGASVATTIRVTDATSGAASIFLSYRSTETTQTQSCTMTRTSGSANDGTWSCTIVFPALAAMGSWVPTLNIRDLAGNQRFYSRRASDGFLCYFDSSTLSQVCKNFGDTELILQ